MGVARAALLLCAAAASASAAPASDAARIDWAANAVTAGGVGIADRHAPSPAVARGTSRRAAEDAAKRAIAAVLPSVPLAAGGTLADRLADPGVKHCIDGAVADALALAAEPDTDGSWHVTLGVPLEALRLALAGARVLPPAGDAGAAPVLVVEGATAKPALGYTVSGVAVATWWAKAVPAWAKDAPRAKATSAKGGAIEISGPAPSAATLVVILTR